ncbi:hypothetical protein AKJ16_DCAP16050, partial [Drosera capensis]
MPLLWRGMKGSPSPFTVSRRPGVKPIAALGDLRSGGDSLTRSGDRGNPTSQNDFGGERIGSELLRTTMEVKELVQSEFQKVEEVILSHQQLLPSPVTLDDFFWASRLKASISSGDLDVLQFLNEAVKQLSFTGREEDDLFHGHGSINERKKMAKMNAGSMLLKWLPSATLLHTSSGELAPIKGGMSIYCNNLSGTSKLLYFSSKMDEVLVFLPSDKAFLDAEAFCTLVEEHQDKAFLDAEAFCTLVEEHQECWKVTADISHLRPAECWKVTADISHLRPAGGALHSIPAHAYLKGVFAYELRIKLQSLQPQNNSYWPSKFIIAWIVDITMVLAFYVRIELLCFLDRQWSWDPRYATGLQIPGALHELYQGDGALGAIFTKESIALHLWAPAAQPEDWANLADEKPRLLSFYDVSLYELHIRDF